MEQIEFNKISVLYNPEVLETFKSLKFQLPRVNWMHINGHGS